MNPYEFRNDYSEMNLSETNAKPKIHFHNLRFYSIQNVQTPLLPIMFLCSCTYICLIIFLYKDMHVLVYACTKYLITNCIHLILLLGYVSTAFYRSFQVTPKVTRNNTQTVMPYLKHCSSRNRLILCLQQCIRLTQRLDNISNGVSFNYINRFV